jgi:hypothetical protein
MTDEASERPRPRRVGRYKKRPKCGAKTDHGPCRSGAGAGTNHKGVGACKHHGGATPNAQIHAERVTAEREASAAVARFGLDMTDIGASDALIREVRRSAAMVAYLAFRVAQLADEDLIWGLTKETIRQGDDGGERVDTEKQARQNIWVVMLREERLLLAKVAAEAARAGVEDRLAREIELQGALMVRFINAVFSDPEMRTRPEQFAAMGTVVPRHLRAIGGEA